MQYAIRKTKEYLCTMIIKLIKKDRKRFLDLLLLADYLINSEDYNDNIENDYWWFASKCIVR